LIGYQWVYGDYIDVNKISFDPGICKVSSSDLTHQATSNVVEMINKAIDK